MTQLGTVIDGKYEILKEIGRGGMSIVYLAMDKRLNKQWAIKEIKKRGGGKNDEVIVNSLIAEANLMKRLDHPALPRIVDIIDNGVTIYVIMDYIEGESLDKILNEYGAQPEETVISWSKQLCDALGFLHSQKPPIIYRDMKPANVMLKPEGNIKIIDFGIAREYKEQKLKDTTVLGTKGYAPPEQYSGQTDARSDIYALGMTMHQLLTGVDPRTESYIPIRQWNPELSEGMEAIIDKCVEPAAENRYQNCADLLYDLEHPDLITKGYKRKQRRKLISFIAAAGLSLILAITGVVLGYASTHVKNTDYESLVGTADPTNYYDAIEIYPERTDAYYKLIEYYRNHGAENKEIQKLGTRIDTNSSKLDITDPEVARLYYDMGKLYFSESNDGLKERAAYALPFFSTASEESTNFDKKEIADCYYAICRHMTTQSKTSEPALDDYVTLFDEIKKTMAIVEKASDNEANYDKITLYYVTMLLINDQAEYMAGVGFDKQEALNLLDDISRLTNSITSTLPYVNEHKEKIEEDYPQFVWNLNAKYNEVEKRQNGGEENG